ncbi:MAG: hypothetical protein D6714_04100 [Bacteroidetes bacterium]|nr:MAG: hypothetical protein D6714_04100 [Bacteroidota bacterium]
MKSKKNTSVHNRNPEKAVRKADDMYPFFCVYLVRVKIRKKQSVRQILRNREFSLFCTQTNHFYKIIIYHCPPFGRWAEGRSCFFPTRTPPNCELQTGFYRGEGGGEFFGARR